MYSARFCTLDAAGAVELAVAAVAEALVLSPRVLVAVPAVLALVVVGVLQVAVVSDIAVLR